MKSSAQTRALHSIDSKKDTIHVIQTVKEFRIWSRLCVLLCPILRPLFLHPRLLPWLLSRPGSGPGPGPVPRLSHFGGSSHGEERKMARDWSTIAFEGDTCRISISYKYIHTYIHTYIYLRSWAQKGLLQVWKWYYYVKLKVWNSLAIAVCTSLVYKTTHKCNTHIQAQLDIVHAIVCMYVVHRVDACT
jgi:hypothetical protein